MSVLVHVTFDLDGADPSDYEKVKDYLAKKDLLDWTVSSTGKFVELPSNTFLAEYDVPFTNAIRDQVTNYIATVFKACGVKGKIFVTAGQGWAWKHTVV